MSDHAKAATISTLWVLAVIFGLGGLIWTAQHYHIVEQMIGWGLVAFGVFTIWMIVYNDSKIQENGDGWGCR